MRFTTLEEWLQWLECQHPRAIDLGLERVSVVAKALNIALAMPVITVAGTNGKGSCVALSSAILGAEGYRVGTYTSPHLVHYNERIVIAGRYVSDDELLAAFSAIDEARGATSLTYFEFGTLAALWLFQRAELDVVILEVGLGGRLDAVNIVDADIAIVSSIAIDHEAWLGRDREVIGREKAGIFRQGRIAVVGDVNPPQSVLSYGRDIGATVLCRDRDFSYSESTRLWDWQGVDAQGDKLEYHGLPLPSVLLDNAATVLQALQYLDLNVSDAAVRSGLSLVELSGRCQHIALDGVDIVLDVAHNPAAVVTLRQHLQQYPVSGRSRCVFAVMADKAIAEMLSILQPSFENWWLADLDGNSRAVGASDVAGMLMAQQVSGVEYGGSVAASIQQAIAQSASGDRVVVFGSFFTVAEAMLFLSERGGVDVSSVITAKGNTL